MVFRFLPFCCFEGPRRKPLNLARRLNITRRVTRRVTRRHRQRLGWLALGLGLAIALDPTIAQGFPWKIAVGSETSPVPGAAAIAAETPPAASTVETSYRGLGRDSVSPAVLDRYAPPPLDPALANRVRTLFELRSPGAGLLSPDGQQLFFQWSVTGVSQIWRMDGPDAFPVQMTGGNDPAYLLDISPDGQWLFVSRDRQGEENPGLYLQSVRGGPLHPIQHEPGVQTFLLHVGEDSRTLYFAANDRRPDSYTIYRYDLQTREKTPVVDNPGRWFVSDVGPQGQLLIVNQIGNFAREYYELDANTHRLKPLLGKGEHRDYRAQYGANPGELVVLTPEFGEYARLYRYADGEFFPLTPEVDREVEGFYIDEARQRILYTVNDRGYLSVRALDARRFEPLPFPEFPDAATVSVGSVSRDGRFVTLSVDAGDAPDSRYAFDWTSGELTRWTQPSLPEVDVAEFVAPVLESYPARDGTEIPMFVWRSPECAATACPVVVQFHGGPEAQSYPEFNRFAQLLVQAGFVYVEPNVRGSSGYGTRWLEADDGPNRLNVIGDIEDCARYIRTAWQRDGQVPKIGVMGGSYGGYAALLAMTKFAGSYDAGVSIVGISNLVTFLENTAPYRRELRVLEYGDPVRDREALLALSPITYIDRVRDPLLIIQGVNDPRVPVGEALQMQAALEARGIPSQLMLFPDEGHGTVSQDNLVLQLGHAIAFFERHLR